jgi:hypothetical protein
MRSTIVYSSGHCGPRLRTLSHRFDGSKTPAGGDVSVARNTVLGGLTGADSGLSAVCLPHRCCLPTTIDRLAARLLQKVEPLLARSTVAFVDGRNFHLLQGSGSRCGRATADSPFIRTAVE